MKNLICIAAVAAVLTCTTAFAGEVHKTPGFNSGDPFHVVIDESGNAPTLNGVALTGVLGADGNMVWNLGRTVTTGDLLINEPGVDGKPGILSDVLRFKAIKGCDFTGMTFYSDGEQDDSLVDLGLPSHLQDNQFCIIEPNILPETMNYVAGCATYCITSDSLPNNVPPVPEPSSFAFLATAGLPLLGILRRKFAI